MNGDAAVWADRTLVALADLPGEVTLPDNELSGYEINETSTWGELGFSTDRSFRYCAMIDTWASPCAGSAPLPLPVPVAVGSCSAMGCCSSIWLVAKRGPPRGADGRAERLAAVQIGRNGATDPTGCWKVGRSRTMLSPRHRRNLLK